MRMSCPRAHRPSRASIWFPGVADARAAIVGKERQGVALQARSLREPEEHEREQGDQGCRNGAHREPDLDDLGGIRRRARLERRLDGVQQRGHALGQGLRLERGAPASDAVEEIGQPTESAAELDDRRRDDEHGHGDDDREECDVHDEDRQATSDTGPAPDGRNDRLQGCSEEHGEEDEEEDLVRGHGKHGEDQDEPGSDRQPGAARRPARRLLAHPCLPRRVATAGDPGRSSDRPDGRMLAAPTARADRWSSTEPVAVASRARRSANAARRREGSRTTCS